jgi:hypothetical protein
MFEVSGIGKDTESTRWYSCTLGGKREALPKMATAETYTWPAYFCCLQATTDVPRTERTMDSQCPFKSLPFSFSAPETWKKIARKKRICSIEI